MPDRKSVGHLFLRRLMRFCWGFWEKQVVERGFLMVNVWWNRGKSWWVDGRFSDLKKCHGFRIYFA
jgi:hypothetical protein